MTILIPLHNLDGTGVRNLSDADTIQRALGILAKEPDKKISSLDLSPSGWNKRNKEYQLLIQSGSLDDIAKIYRDLIHISLQKDLSFGEKNLLQMTEELLAQEITTVRNIERAEFLQELRSPFKHLFVAEQPVVEQTHAP